MLNASGRYSITLLLLGGQFFAETKVQEHVFQLLLILDCSKIDITANKICYQKKSLVLIFTENPTTAFTRDVYFHHVLPHSVRASVALANWDGSGWIEHVGQGVGEAVTPHNTTWIDVMRDTSLTCSGVCVLSNLMPM